MKYYVYYLIDPFTNKVFYVGKGTGKRMYMHEKSALNGFKPNNNTALYNKIIDIHINDSFVKYEKIFETNDETIAYQVEMDEIFKIGIQNLTNLSTTRNYKGNSEYVKIGLKRSKKNLERLEFIKTEEYRNKCKENNTGDKNPMFNIKWNSLQRKNIIEANKKPKSELHKENISKSLKGRNITKEHRDNLSSSLKNSIIFQTKMKSEEYRHAQSIKSQGANNPNAKTFKFISPENIEYIVTGSFVNFCRDHKLSLSNMRKVKNKELDEYKSWKVLEIL